MYWFVCIVIWLLFAIACSSIAKKKNRSSGGWFVLGFLFGIFALLVIALLPDA